MGKCKMQYRDEFFKMTCQKVFAWALVSVKLLFVHILLVLMWSWNMYVFEEFVMCAGYFVCWVVTLREVFYFRLTLWTAKLHLSSFLFSPAIGRMYRFL